VNEKSADLRQLVKRLDALINLLLETADPKGKGLAVSKKIEILDTAGLRPVEISQILGLTLSNVTTQLTRLRKKGAKLSR
jgi:DNA-binding MarR family transcriptional regulator